MATYAFSDIHGNYELWTAIKNYCKSDDTIFFLGDAIDRGNDGIKILQEMIADPRIIFLLGNHEDMLLGYIEDGINRCFADPAVYSVIEDNGTEKTLKDFQNLTSFEQQEIIDYLENKTFIKYIYNNKERKIVLCHCGCNAKLIDGEYPVRYYIWNRKHLQTKEWNPNYNDFIVVHGHTPVQYLYYFMSDKSIKNGVIDLMLEYDKLLL